MKKLLLLSMMMLVFIVANNVYAQYDARKIPVCLDAKHAGEPKYTSKSVKAMYNNFPPEAFKKWQGKDRLLTEDGVPVMNITKGSNNQSETWIVVNPKNPNNIIAGANDYRYYNSTTGYRMGAYYSMDAGQTWAHSYTPNCENNPIEIPSGKGMLVFDPGLAFDTRGWCYYSYGACQTGPNSENYDNGVFVSRSKDGGKTWEEHVPVTISMEGIQFQEFNDRYSITCDTNPNSNYKDYIYITWRRFIKNDGIYISVSSNGGDDWSQPRLLFGASNEGTQSPVPIIGPNGEVYVVWRSQPSGMSEAVIQKSLDGGKTWWSAPKLAQSVRPTGTKNSQNSRDVLVNKASLRVSSLPYISVDCSIGPRRGYIYVVQTGKDESNKDRVFLAVSKDGGLTWQSKIPIDDNALGNDMFFPGIAVDPVTGLVAVVYYSSQNDPENKGFDAYCAVSFDGTNFTHVRLTPQMIYVQSANDVAGDGNNNYWGDYTGIAAYNGRVYPCWWMPDAYNTPFWTDDAYVALMSMGPKVPKNLTYENTWQAPTQVKLRWTDPDKNQLGGDVGDFTIIIYRNDVKIGEANKGVQEYTDNTAVDGQSYTYSIKAKSKDGIESAAVSVSLTAGGSLKLLPPTEIRPVPNAQGILLSWVNPSYHIDSSLAKDLSKIIVYKDSIAIQTVEANIQAGQISSVQVNLPTEKFYKIMLKAVGKRGTVETESDFSTEMIAYSGALLTIINDYFDNTATALPTYSNNGWGKTNVVSHSAPNCITDSPTGNYKNNSNNDIYFPPLIMDQTKTTLCFDHIALIDNSNDWGIVEISKDFGNTWDWILVVNKTRSAGFGTDVASSQWYSEHRDISKYKNDTIMLRFNLNSNSFRNADGWYIDDLRISNEVVDVDEPVAVQSSLSVTVHPNPAVDNVSVNVTIPMAGKLVIEIYDILGNKLSALADGNYQPASYSFNASLAGLSDGIYYCRVSLNNISRTVPVIINR